MKCLRQIIIAGILLLSAASLRAQQHTYCNPINIDYGYTPYSQFHGTVPPLINYMPV
jgi:xylan 1,4-beta-xylosidase